MNWAMKFRLKYGRVFEFVYAFFSLFYYTGLSHEQHYCYGVNVC